MYYDEKELHHDFRLVAGMAFQASMRTAAQAWVG
jgi:hypothetical protein